MNLELFATALIRGLGFSVNQARINIFLAWFLAENTKAQFNPLATTWKKTGSTFFNCIDKGKKLTDLENCKIGVQNYSSGSVGVQATIDTLEQNFYKPIIKAIEQSKTTFDYNDPELIKAFSTWGTGYKNFLGQFAKYGKVTGSKATSKKDEGTRSNPLYILGALGLIYGIYKYNKA